MIKIILLIIISIVLIIVIGFYKLGNDPFYIINYLKKNPQKTSFYFIENDSECLTLNGNINLLLESIFKIIIDMNSYS